MRRVIFTSFVFSVAMLFAPGAFLPLRAQINAWGYSVGFEYFLDNTEFKRSNLTQDQTLSAVRLSPALQLNWGEGHGFVAGFTALRHTGSTAFVDDMQPVAYYRFERKDQRLFAGLFPRSEALKGYSDFFFQDSIAYFRPMLEGLFWQWGKTDASFLNLWLDWTGRQTASTREAFWLGASAGWRRGVFFTDFRSSLHHFALTASAVPGQRVCDYALTELSLGLRKEKLGPFENVLVSFGSLAGLERERNVSGNTHLPVGMIGRLQLGFRRIGSDNVFYFGAPRMRLYPKLGNAFYWGNPFLRASSYFRSKLYWDVFRSDALHLQIASRFHHSELQWFFEQLLVLQLNLNRWWKKRFRTP